MSTQARQEKTRDSRTAILESARSLFTANGLDAVTMDDIARESGVSRATVFNQFGSKALILDTIGAGVLRNYLHILDNIMDSQQSPTNQLLELNRAMAKGISSNQDFYRAIFATMLTIVNRNEESSSASLVRRELDEKLLKLFLRGQVNGDFSSRYDAEEMVKAFENQIFGNISHWLHQREDESLESSLECSCAILINGIGSQGSA